MNKQQKIKINLNNLYKLIKNDLFINLIKKQVGDVIYIDNFFKNHIYSIIL